MAVAIQTRYAGYHFRSRLEARWAVFLNHLGVPWEYEPEGYQLPSGLYLPDFQVYPGTARAFWLEIKPTIDFNAEDTRKSPRELQLAYELAKATGLWTFVYCRPPGPPVPLSARWAADYVQHHYLDSRWSKPNPEWPWSSWQSGLQATAYMTHPLHVTPPQPGDWWWTECPHCNGFLPTGKGNITGCPQLVDYHSDDQGGSPAALRRVTSPRLLAAYTAARSARFEHGETPR